MFHQESLTRCANQQSQITTIEEHNSVLNSEETLWDNAHMWISSRMWSESFISATPRQPLTSRPNWSDRSNQITCRSRSWKLRSCLWSGFAGYSRTGQLLFCTQHSPPKLPVCLMVFDRILEPLDEYPPKIAHSADKNRTIFRSIEKTSGSGRPDLVKRPRGS